jgi:hypothetical protein
LISALGFWFWVCAAGDEGGVTVGYGGLRGYEVTLGGRRPPKPTRQRGTAPLKSPSVGASGWHTGRGGRPARCAVMLLALRMALNMAKVAGDFFSGFWVLL